MGSILLDPALSDTKLYIWETLLKTKEFLIQEPELIHGFKKEFIWMARNLGFLIDYMEDLEEQSGGLELESASQEGKRALKSFLDYEIRLANNMCNFINSFTHKRDGQLSDYDFDDLSTVLKFSKEMKWIEGASSSNHGRSFQKLDLDMDEEKEEEFSQVIGLEEDVQVLSRRLIQDTQEVMFIVGVQGIGKTTLAMEVYKNNFKDYHFHLRVWVTVSQEFQAVDILRNVLKKIPGLFKTKIFLYTEESAEELAEELLRILRSVRCIVVLDDLRKPKDWTSLRRLLPMFTIGESRILVTTRSREIAATEYSNNHTIHELRTLTDRQGWELFNAKVHVPVELEQYGREILRKCMGLPLAILAVAEILSRRTATKEQWLEVLNQVNESQKSIFHTLSASADSLPSHLKKCLSRVEVFHENYDIPTRRLIVLWVAEGLVYQERYGKVPPEHLAEKLLMEFIKQNMIQAVEWKLNGKVKTCRMNYFLRDNLLSRGKIEDLPSVNNRGAASKPSSSTDILRIADHLNHKDKCFLHIHGIDGISKSTYRQYYRNISSFLSFDSREGPAPGEDIGRFLCRGISSKCFKMLRVLDLEGVFRPQLPDSIGALVQVRYLGLRGSYIEALPSSIGNLLNLQTLDLKHTCIRSLPYSVWKNHQLRHLYLSESYRSRIEAPPSTSSLLDMQTLWGGFVNEETKIAGGLDRLTNVRKLGLVCRLKIPQQIEIGNWVERLSHLESLRLKSIDERVRPSNLYLKSLSGLNNLSSIYLLGKLENPAIMREFPQSLTEITLSLSGLEKDPMSNLRQLPNLRILNLYSGSYTGDFLVCRSGGFPLLQVLNIWKLEGLKAWILEEGAMKILRHVEIRSCNNLRRIPDGMKHLEHCRELILTKMPCEFKARVTENQGKDWHKVAHIPSIVFKD